MTGGPGGNASYFVLCSARSGSTSLARILDTARNGRCAVEPVPNLNVESRLAMEGRGGDPAEVVRDIVVPRVRAALEQVAVYGEKNVTYGPFVAALHEQLGCRFLLLTRDGRDVVRSLLDWHDRVFGTVYRECRDPGALAPRALAAAAALPLRLDASDFARPRPGAGSPWHDRWESLSRLAMCSYYWSTINDLYLDRLATIPVDRWTRLDATGATAEAVLAAAAFCGLEGLDGTAVQSMLDARINSLADRCGEPDCHPSWPDWDGGMRRSFESIAGETMRRLGYWSSERARWRPEGFGRCWQQRAADLGWYEWMFDGRRGVHEQTLEWIRGLDGTDAAVESVADFGCGLGVGYAEALADRRYVGYDLAAESVEWARRHRDNPRHAYRHLDFVCEPTGERYDLVMSSGTIDNAWDVEAFLDAMLDASGGWIHLTCYRGWFPELEEHRYRWSDEHGCFYADVSAQRVRAHLERRGCRDVTIEPMATGREDIPAETLIVARVPAGPVAPRAAEPPPAVTRAAETSSADFDLPAYYEQVRDNYAALAGSFEGYRALIRALERLPRLRPVTLHELATAPPGGPPLLGLRHDVDADPLTGLRMARFLASRGIGGSFYLLHTAIYYGRFEAGRLRRHDVVASWVRGFVVAGCEIGLHNDVLGAERLPGADGPEVLRQEIAWLREQGVVVRGTVAHNSLPVYGAANSEVFTGRRLWPRDACDHDGRPLPLESIDERELGLEYEGTFAAPRPDADPDRRDRFCRDRDTADVRSRDWMRTFLVDNPCCRWTVDLQLWVTGRDQWVIGGRLGGAEVFEWAVSADRVVSALDGLPEGARAMLVVHPVFFMGD